MSKIYFLGKRTSSVFAKRSVSFLGW